MGDDTAFAAFEADLIAQAEALEASMQAKIEANMTLLQNAAAQNEALTQQYMAALFGGNCTAGSASPAQGF